MKSLKPWALRLFLLLLPACGQQMVEFPNPNGGNSDVSSPDHPNGDGVETDAGIPDSPNADGTAIDAPSDMPPPDGQDRDVADADGPALDASASDSLNRDTGRGEAANPDTGVIDAPIVYDARPEGPPLDLSTVDLGIIDTSDIDGEGLPCRQTPVPLGTAAAFALLAGSSVTNTGATSVTGDLGISPGTSVTGFPPGAVAGTQHAGDPTAAQGEADLTEAYNNAAGRTLCAVTVAGNLGGQTLLPGLYKSTSSLGLDSGDLTLDAQGDASAVFIFQIASTLTTDSGRQVVLSGGARASNVFWQVGTSATLGSASVLSGTVMADQSITLATGATLNGRALARIGGVTLDSNAVLKPTP